MAIVNTEDLMSVKDIGDTLQISDPAVRSLMGGIKPELTIGRTALFHKEDVRSLVWNKHQAAMRFLGVRPPFESYDSNITATEAREASEAVASEETE